MGNKLSGISDGCLVTMCRVKMKMRIEVLANYLDVGWGKLVRIESGREPASLDLRQKLEDILMGKPVEKST